MREILFKGKMLNNNEWIEGGLVQRDGRAYIIGVSKKLMIDGIEVNPETVCQLIQNDKVRVWENDIIRWEDDDIISVIQYEEESAKFIIKDYGIKGCLMEYGWDEDAGSFGVLDVYEFDDFCSFDGFEVIGNIFDNPELINR